MTYILNRIENSFTRQGEEVSDLMGNTSPSDYPDAETLKIELVELGFIGWDDEIVDVTPGYCECCGNEVPECELRTVPAWPEDHEDYSPFDRVTLCKSCLRREE